MPAAVWGEVDGTVTNLEGRVQAVKRALPPRGQAQSIMGALSDIAFAMGADLKAFDVATVTKEISTLAPAYEGVTPDYLTFETDGTGVVVPMDGVAQPLGYIPTDMSVPIVTDRFTLHLAASLYDDGVTTRNAPSISGLVPKAVARLNPKDASLLAVSQDSVVTIADVLELPVAVDSTVVQGSVVVPFNHAATKGLSATAAVAVAAVRSEI